MYMKTQVLSKEFGEFYWPDRKIKPLKIKRLQESVEEKIEISFGTSKGRTRRADSHLGTPSAAKSLGRLSSQGVGDFAHRSFSCPRLKF
jgi:hypothetical protein